MKSHSVFFRLTFAFVALFIMYFTSYGSGQVHQQNKPLIIGPTIAVDDSYTADQDTILNVPASGGVKANDTIGGPLFTEIVTNPNFGSVTMNPIDGSFSYTPFFGYTGPDSFTYGYFVGNTQLSNTATVSLSVGVHLVSANFQFPGVVAGNNVQLQVTLDKAAPYGGAPVNFHPGPGIKAPASLSIPQGSTTYTFTLATDGVSSITLSSIIVSRWNASVTANLSLVPASLQTLQSASPSVVGGGDVAIIATLNGKAPATGGQTIPFQSDNAAASPTGDFVFAANSTQAVARIHTTPVSTDTVVTLSTQVSSASTAVTVMAPSVVHFSLSPATVTGGRPALLTVSLNGPAPTGGLTIDLTPSSSAITTTSVVVPAGQSYVQTPIQTTGVSSQQTVTITSSPSSQQASLLVNPPTILSVGGPSQVVSGNAINLIISLNVPASNGNGGFTIDLGNGASLLNGNVPNGQTSVVYQVASSHYTATGSYTLQASNTFSSAFHSLTVNEASLLKIALNQTTFDGGQGTYGAIYLNGSTTTSRTVTLTSNDPNVIFTPSTVTLGAGARGGQFNLNVKRGAAAGTATVTATDTGTNQTVQLTITLSGNG